MCSWCWGFAPVLEAIGARFGAAVPVRVVMGGLRPGTTEPMTAARMAETRGHWNQVHAASGQPFDPAFFERDGFVYDTEPACRAVVVMRRHGLALEGLHRIQAAFYAANRDVTSAAVLEAVAEEAGMAGAVFRAAFEGARAETQEDFRLAAGAGVRGFPTLIAGTGVAGTGTSGTGTSGAGEDGTYRMVTNGFQPAEAILPALERWVGQNTHPPDTSVPKASTPAPTVAKPA